jgi:hypothetical protein
MRAPPVFLDYLESRGICLLAEVFDIQRGITTGANDFFYFTQIAENGNLVQCKSRYRTFWLEKKYTRPFIKGPQEVRRLIFGDHDTNRRLFWCPHPKSDLRGTYALEYIEWAESFAHTSHGTRHRSFRDRPSFGGRPTWYQLREFRPTHYLMQAAFDTQYAVRYSTDELIIDKRLYALYPVTNIEPFHPKILIGVLNSSWTALSIELCGAVNLGEGVLGFKVWEAESLPVLDPRRLSAAQQTRMVELVSSLSKYPIEPIFELMKRSETREIDEIVAVAAGLPVGAVDLLHAALAALVTQRKSRAKSVASEALK